MYEPFVLKSCYVFTKKILKELGGAKNSRVIGDNGKN